VRPFYFHEAWRSFRHHRGLASTAILALTAVLTVAGVFVLLAYNARVTMRVVGDRREMVVYLKDEVTREEREAMMGRLRSLYGAVTYVSKEEAWQDFSDQIGDPQLLESVDGNPLPASLRIRLRPELLNYAAMEQTARQLEQFPEVEDVRFGGDWVKRLDSVGRALERGAIAVGALVALVVVFVLYTTIRLTLLARRPQVEIMSRLGATDRFIATPFILEALLQAGIATALTLGGVFAFHQAFVARIVPIAFLPWSWIVAFLASVLLLAWIAAVLALSRVMRAVGA
jgi:cell division transport system permease protein